MQNPEKKMIVDVLAETARRVGMESMAEHPEDIAVAMSMAIDSAGMAVEILQEGGNLTSTPKV